jgi:hypothetical protein
MEPFMSRFIGEARMPGHEIGKGLDLTRRFHDAYTSHARSDLCQSARHSENQVSLRDGKDRGHKEWQSKRDTAATERDPLKPVGPPVSRPARAEIPDIVSA